MFQNDLTFARHILMNPPGNMSCLANWHVWKSQNYQCPCDVFFNWIKRSHIEFTGIYCALMSGRFDSIIVVHFNRTQFFINNKITWKMLLLWFLITCHIRLFPTKICLIKYLSLHKLGQNLTNSVGIKRLYWLILKIGKLFKCKSI